MTLEEETHLFKHWIEKRVEKFISDKPSEQNGSIYFSLNFFVFFGEFQRHGQNILNRLEHKYDRATLQPFARSLQSISENAMLSLKTKLEE